MNTSFKKFFLVLILLGACLVLIFFAGRSDIVTRKDWGALPLDFTNPKLISQTASAIVIHHGGVVLKKETSSAEYLRSLQLYSRNEKNWPDLPYHFLIDSDGEIFEGLPLGFCGSTNTNYDPCNKIHLTVLGNFNEQQPDEPLISALKTLIASLGSRFSIGQDSIFIHSELAVTQCPGSNIEKIFGKIKSGL